MFDNTTLSLYRALKNDVASANVNSCLVQLTGSDRLRFLHNFCTNEIKSLPSLGVCEAFILDGKGKTLFHVHVINGQDKLWLHSIANDADEMVKHLDKYLLRDDVQMTAVTDRKSKFVTGPNAETALSNLITSAISQNQVLELPENTLVVHLELAGWGYLILSPNNNVVADSIPQANHDALHAVRIENQTPWMGIDIDASNLPQELLRDDKCISFDKGCYLGQETVARIDAIGRVNRVIALVKFSEAVESDSELIVADKKVGNLLSVTWSPDQQSFLALAMVRRPHQKPGTELMCGSAKVTVV